MKSEKISKKVLREFGILIGIAFPFIIGLIIPLIRNHSFQSWTLIISLPFLTLSISNPLYLKYPYKFWMFLGFILGWINSRLILSFIYITVLLPIAFFMRFFFKHNPLKLKLTKEDSYRESKVNHLINLKEIF